VAVSSHTSLPEDSCVESVDGLLNGTDRHCRVPVVCTLDLATQESGAHKVTPPIFCSGASARGIALAIG
jgi:hypothetical protein